MLQQQLQRKQKSFALPRGLYVLRYETSVDPSNPPLVTVFCEPERNEVILHPDQPLATLSGPGQAMIIRANDTGNVRVEISSTAPMNTLDATLKFEPIRRDLTGGQAPGRVAQFAAPPAQAGFSAPRYGWGGDSRESLAPAIAQPKLSGQPNIDATSSLQIIGHVARLGDVTCHSDEWVAGPSAPGRIEGFLVRWPTKPLDVQLRYSGMSAGQRAGEARVCEIDEFSGTRGRARPLTGLSIELVGPGAHNYQLSP